MKYSKKQSQDRTSKGLIVLLIAVVVMMIAMVVVVIALIVPAITMMTDANITNNDSTDTSTQNIEQTAKKDNEKPTITVDLATIIDSTDLERLLNEGESGFLYVGRPTCPHCRVFMPLLNQSLRADDTVFYFNTDENRALDAEKMSELLGQLDINSVPTFIRLENGVEIARLDNTADQLVLNEFLAQYR